MQNGSNGPGGGLIGTLLTLLGASLSVTEVQAVISIIVTVVGFGITLITQVIIPVILKWRQIRKDGRITDEELKEFKDTLDNGLNKINKDGKE